MFAWLYVGIQSLAELAREGALVVGGNVLDFGLQTTPQLHHLVRMVSSSFPSHV